MFGTRLGLRLELRLGLELGLVEDFTGGKREPVKGI